MLRLRGSARAAALRGRERGWRRWRAQPGAVLSARALRLGGLARRHAVRRRKLPVRRCMRVLRQQRVHMAPSLRQQARPIRRQQRAQQRAEPAGRHRHRAHGHVLTLRADCIGCSRRRPSLAYRGLIFVHEPLCRRQQLQRHRAHLREQRADAARVLDAAVLLERLALVGQRVDLFQELRDMEGCVHVAV
eukprot:358486-Chlamydomonas_euryale.AAC.9